MTRTRYQGKTSALGNVWLEACEFLGVIHRKSTLLVALKTWRWRGAIHQPQAIDQMKPKLMFLLGSPTGLFGTDSVQRGALDMEVRVSI